ncbi:hypothetical protein JZ751_005113, partial [Albula glossodonta]
MSEAKGDTLYQLNMQRETWCRVEGGSKFWTHAERRHFACHLQSTCDFKSPTAQRSEQRSSWIRGVAKLAERKHFAQNITPRHTFTVIDQNCYDFITKEDLMDTYAAMGCLNVPKEELDAMMKEASGPLNFTTFLTIAAYDPVQPLREDEIKSMWSAFPSDMAGNIDYDNISSIITH